MCVCVHLPGSKKKVVANNNLLVSTMTYLLSFTSVLSRYSLLIHHNNRCWPIIIILSFKTSRCVRVGSRCVACVPVWGVLYMRLNRPPIMSDQSECSAWIWCANVNDNNKPLVAGWVLRLQVDILPACNIPGNNCVVLVPCLHLLHWDLSHLGCSQRGEGQLLEEITPIILVWFAVCLGYCIIRSQWPFNFLLFLTSFHAYRESNVSTNVTTIFLWRLKNKLSSTGYMGP